MGSCGFPQLVQEMEQGDADYGIERGQHGGALPVEYELLAEERARHDPIQELVKHVKEEAQQEADQAVFDVQAHADGRGEVADQGI